MPERRPRLRTVLLAVNLLILVLPLAGIVLLRLYENELVRGTEAQLIAQGVVVREIFFESWLDAGGGHRPVDAEGALAALESVALLPQLDLSEARALPPAPQGLPSTSRPDPRAATAGERIEATVRNAARSSLTGIRVVDSAGTVVASSGSEKGLSLAHREEVARALQGERVSLLRQRFSDEKQPPLRSISRGQRYRVFVALPVTTGNRVIGAVVLSRTPLDIVKALYLNRRPVLLGGVAILVVVVLASLVTSLAISRPLSALVQQAESVRRGDSGGLVPVRRPVTHEVAQLSEAIAGMARTLGERAAYIRTFASHVSHEFKTPLTTLRGSLELLRDHLETMSREEQKRFLANATDATARLGSLVQRLLDLARAEALAPRDEQAEVGMVVDSVARRHLPASLGVTVDHAAGAARVRMSPETLEEVLSGLLGNARQHGGEGVHVRVATSRKITPSGRLVVIRVEDDGPGVTAANASRVFTPFFTTARERGGSGLGLSIVRALLEAHGGTIRLVRPGRGAVFEIEVPAV